MNLPREQFKLLVMYLRTVAMLFDLPFRSYVFGSLAFFVALFLVVMLGVYCVCRYVYLAAVSSL